MSESGDVLERFLSRGQSYGLPDVAVSRIETHCSEVFLVGNQAYKLKRPIAFSSLDYRTLARREAACRAELALNRRTAPELYLGLHAIRRRADGTLRLDGEGTIVDWVVAMRRFDQADLFDRLAETGKLTSLLARALAEEIARCHGEAERTPRYGGASGLRDAIEQNHADLLTVSAILGQDKIDRLYSETLRAFAPLAERLDARRGEKVRRVHGDLRLANICLLDGRPTLFDAIEFSEELACIDLLYDLSFLLVDLHHRSMDMLANIVFNRYLDAMAGPDDLAVLPLMLSVRAAMRAYTLAGSSRRRTKQAEIAKFAASAQSMLGLASTLLHPPRPRLVAIGGFGGSRKSELVDRVAAEIRPMPGARVLRSDHVRREVVGIGHDARLSPGAYEAGISDAVYDELVRQGAALIESGHSAVIDASFFYPRHRRAVRALADRVGVSFTGLWLGGGSEMLVEPDAPDPNWPAFALEEPAQTLAAARRLMGPRVL